MKKSAKKKQENFLEVDDRGGFWNPDEGDGIIGTFIKTVMIKNRKGELTERYVILDKDNIEFILPSHVNLDAKMSQVEVGGDVIIKLKEIAPTKGGQRFFKYSVQTNKPKSK